MRLYRIHFTLDTELPEARTFIVLADGHQIDGPDHLFHRDGQPIVRIAIKLVDKIAEI